MRFLGNTSSLHACRLPRVIAAFALGAALPLLGACGNGGTPASVPSGAASTSGVRVTQPAEAWRIIQTETPRPVVLDVRTAQEFSQGHLPGAVNIDFSAADFAERIGALDRTKEYVIYCRTGHRSGQTRELMARLKFTRVIDIAGGITAWHGARLPVTTE